MSKNKRGTRAVNLHLPEELADRLRLTAEERLVSVNLLATKAIEHFLDRLIPVDELWTREEGKGDG